MPWQKKDQSSTIVCRPALPLDTPDMIELTRHIWEGEDYVPDAWPHWLLDSEGLLAVAQVGGKVVGIGKLTQLCQSDWWLEGLRVHPEYEGRGIASYLNGYMLDFWLRNGSGVIRLATMSSREPVKHLARKNGFQLIAEYATYQSRIPQEMSLFTHASPFQSIKAAEIIEAVEWLTAPNQKRLPYGLMDLGWQFAEPKAEYFTNYVKNQQAWWWRYRRGMLIMVDKENDSESRARIRMLACEDEDYLPCLSDTHSFAGHFGYEGLDWKAPCAPEYDNKLQQAGYQRENELTLLIFEKHFPDN